MNRFDGAGVWCMLLAPDRLTTASFKTAGANA
jgi:hypothetical protein